MTNKTSDTLVISMKLKSGQFESELQIPFDKDKAEDLGTAIGAWLKSTAAMLPIAQSNGENK